MTTPPRGWYPDPSDPDRKIYWDGTAWAVAPAAAYPDLLVGPEQVKVSPFYWPNLIAALIGSICVAVGSVGPWISFMGMTRNAIGMGRDGTITLILGIIAALALFALLNFGRTEVRSRRMVSLGTVAGIAGAAAFVTALASSLEVSSREVEFMGQTMGPEIGWGLWMILIGGPVLAATSAIVVWQVKAIAKTKVAGPAAIKGASVQPPAPSPKPAPPQPVRPADTPIPPAPPAPPVQQAASGLWSPPAESAGSFPAQPAAAVSPASPTKHAESDNSGIRRIAPWAAGVAAVGAAFAGGILVATQLTGGNQNNDKEPAKTATGMAAPTTSADSVTAEDVFWAIRGAGLPATDPRDNSQTMCGNVGCVQLMTTDDVSIYQFPDPDSAARWASGFDSSGYRNGTVVLLFNEGGSNPTDVADIPRYKDILDGLMGG